MTGDAGQEERSCERPLDSPSWLAVPRAADRSEIFSRSITVARCQKQAGGAHTVARPRALLGVGAAAARPVQRTRRSSFAVPAHGLPPRLQPSRPRSHHRSSPSSAAAAAGSPAHHPRNRPPGSCCASAAHSLFSLHNSMRLGCGRLTFTDAPNPGSPAATQNGANDYLQIQNQRVPRFESLRAHEGIRCPVRAHW
jgi:hypothetical protein